MAYLGNKLTSTNNAYNLGRVKWKIQFLDIYVSLLQADKEVLRKPPQVIYANRQTV